MVRGFDAGSASASASASREAFVAEERAGVEDPRVLHRSNLADDALALAHAIVHALQGVAVRGLPPSGALAALDER